MRSSGAPESSVGPHGELVEPRGRGVLDLAQMIALGLAQTLVADLAERAALAGLLDAGPDQRRIEIVAAIGVDRAGLDLGAELCRRVEVVGPDRGGEASPPRSG